MKKTLTLLLTLTILFLIFAFPVNASAKTNIAVPGNVVDIEYLDNGDYIITTIEDNSIILPGDSTNAATTVTKTKTANYYNSAGNIMWYVKVQGTFTYDGSTSKCTNATHKAAAIGSTWSIVSASSSKSGNTATAKATARHTTAGGSSDYTRSVTLTCSKTGVFS